MNHLLPGTVVSVPFGPFLHFGLVSDRRGSGTPYIISCSGRAGQVVEETAHEFANGGDIKVHGYPGSLSPHEVIQRARRRMGTKYDLFKWNCEHFARWAHDLKPESPQLQATVAVCLLLLGSFWLARKA